MEYKRFARMITMILVSLVLSACNLSQVPPTATHTPTATLAPTLLQGETEYTLMVDDLERSYLLYVPTGLSSQQSVPVVFAFHNWDTSPSTMKRNSKLNDVADLETFLVVYPWGIGRSWNTGEHGPGDAIEQNIDESAFIREMLADLGTIANIDPKRIYAVGDTQGGGLVYRLACDMSDTIAAIASVSGPMDYSACNPTQAVSVLHFHGLKDYGVPFSGGGPHNNPPVEDGINTWVEFNECTSPAVEEKVGDDINRIAYPSCRDGTIVELYTNDTRGHTWPDWFPTPASEYIWEFFAAHPKP